jgi:hypothetical protein
MADRKHRVSIVELVVALLIGGVFSAWVFFFFLQTPILSRREPFFGLVLFICFVPALYFLITRFLAGARSRYTPRGRVGLLLLSALIGFFAVLITLKVPYFIRALPIHTVEINVPAGDAARQVTLQWFTTSLGDIGFGQLGQEGEWQRTDSGLAYSGATPAQLQWHGRPGDVIQLVFIGNPSAGKVTISVDGNPWDLDLTAADGTAVKYEKTFAVNQLNPALVLFSLWASVAFLFLVITLFLLQVPLKVGEKFKLQLGKLENTLQPVSGIFSPKQGRAWWQGRDWAIIAIFLLMAGLFFLGRWNGLKPFVDLQGDAAYVSSYAVSLDLFNQPENFGYYVSVQVAIIRFLKGILGDIGTAYIVLLVPYILAQLAGFYVFGRVLFRNRFYAFLLAILSLLLVNTQSWDYWGVFYDPQPRMLFQAVFPWLLTLVILSLERRWLRWLVIYLHPVSTPAVAFAIWFGYLVSKPSEVKWGRHLLDLALFGVIFLLCAIPFFMQYLGNRDISRSVQVEYNTGLAFYKEVFTTTFQLRKTQAMMILGAIASGLVPLAYLGTIAVVRSGKERERLKLILAWLGGILLICFGFSALEQQLEFHLRVLPVLIQITRGFRYVVPLLEVLILWPLAIWWEDASEKTGLKITRRLTLAVGGILVLVFCAFRFPTTFEYPIPDYTFKSVECFMKGQVTCPNEALVDQGQVAEYIRTQTPPGSRFVSIPPTDIGGAIRFQALRPLAFDPKDLLRLVMGNLGQALALKGDNQAWDAIASKPAGEQLRTYLEFAAGVNADFAVIQNPAPDWLAGKVVYSNATYSLINLR